jgi:hypothetical protein
MSKHLIDEETLKDGENGWAVGVIPYGEVVGNTLDGALKALLKYLKGLE